MERKHVSPILRCIRRMAGPPPAGDQLDRELLERFATGQEETAFEALMERHGPMVLGVCKRLLSDANEAEDAFQATFLVLARRAGSLDRRGSVAGWLYTVAYRLAIRAKADAFRRRLRTKQLDEVPARSSNDSIWWEMRPIIDEEVNRLPDKYRAPVVLCYLEGKTNEEAAGLLGCPTGTVSSRLARARDMLRGRLTRRGLALSAGLFVTALAQAAEAAPVPGALKQATVQAAISFLCGGASSVMAPPAAVLAEGFLHTMFATRLKIAFALALLLGLTGMGAGALLRHALADRGQGAERSGPARAAVAAVEPGDPECKDHKPGQKPTLIAKPEAFETLVNPACSHCVQEAKRRKEELRGNDRVLAWVRGYSDGGAIPYRFFLNPYRVISDTYGVFVYDPDAGFARGFAPSKEFRFHGWRNGVMVIKHQDGTLYSSLTGIAFDGPKKGTRLAPVPTLASDWGFWLKRYPGAVAYHMYEKYRPVELPTKVQEDSCKSRGPADRRLASSTPVLGVAEGNNTRAYPLDVLAKKGMIHEKVDGKERVVLWIAATKTAAAYRPVASPPQENAGKPRPVTLALDPKEAVAPFVDKETGSRWDIAGRAVNGPLKGWTLTWLDGVQVKWFAWAAEYPETSLYAK